MIYKSNVKDVILNIKHKLLSNESQQALIQTIAQAVYASNQKRVFTHGLKLNNSPIGKYSNKALYVGNKNSPKKVKPIGKTGKTVFKNGKKHKTQYFSDGYKGYRASQGRDASRVNLYLTGSLFSNFQNVKTANGYTIGFLSAKKGKIADGLEEHFGGQRIFGITDNDRKVINEIVKNWLVKK
jgi:hypothetical protein